MTSFAAFATADARLVILRALADQTNHTLNEVLLTRALEAFGHHKSRDYVVTQLNTLEELGALTQTKSGTVAIATLTRAGQDHVERRAVIEGVARPSPEA